MWLSLILQLARLLMEQYNKYKEENGLDDAGMKAHLKALNAEDDAGFDAIIAIAEAQKAGQP